MACFHRFFILFLLLTFFPLSGRAQPTKLELVCDEWPPYQIVRDGRVEGFSTEVVKIVLESIGMVPERIRAYPWKRALQVLRSGHADGLFSANFTEDRLRFARYPDETLVESPWVIWVRRGAEFSFEEMSDLRGKRIGVVNGYSYTPEFWDYIRKHAVVDPVISDETNFRKLPAGRLDCLIAELGNGLSLRRTLGLPGIVPQRENPVKVDGLYLIFNRERVDEAAVSRFSETLKAFKEGPVYRELRRKYFGAE